MNSMLVWSILLLICIGSTTCLDCYFCANCPYPFNPYSSAVTIGQSNTGYCAKKSTTSVPGAPASRGPAEYGLCYSSGCRFTTDSFGRSAYTCCCRNNRCNTGSILSKSSIAVLFSTVAVLFVNRYV